MTARERLPAGLPWGLKLAFTGFMAVWVPVVLASYGPLNFLWICNLCNFVLLVALWVENRLWISSQAVGVLLLDGAWTVDLLVALATGTHPLGATRYMFNAELPLAARLLSLYHVAVPLVILWAVRRLGYDRRALGLQSALTAPLLVLSFVLSPVDWNINWVFGPGSQQTWMPGWLYLLAIVVLYPLLIYWPAHAGLSAWHRRRARPAGDRP